MPREHVINSGSFPGEAWPPTDLPRPLQLLEINTSGNVRTNSKYLLHAKTLLLKFEYNTHDFDQK